MTTTHPSVVLNQEKLVIKDNALIMASYTLTVEEQRLVLACIEKAQRQKKPLDNRAIKIVLSVQEYAELYGVKMGTAYKALRSASNKLYDRSIRIVTDGTEKRSRRWLQEHAEYETGRVELMFSEAVSKHISEIVTVRSAYRLTQATQLRSQHALRLFEILQTVIDQETQQGSWEVTIEELKDLFEVQNNYPRWADLKRKVIEESVNQINKNTSLKVDWEVTGKTGKRISKIKFNVFESHQLSLSLN